MDHRCDLDARLTRLIHDLDDAAVEAARMPGVVRELAAIREQTARLRRRVVGTPRRIFTVISR